MSSADDEALDDDLIAHMAFYDSALAEGADSSLLDAVPLAEAFQARWRGLQGCMRRLRDFFPPRSPLSLLAASPSGTFGRFHIRQEIGRGGFGIVLLADDPQLRRLVALKLPRPETLANEDRRQRFLREARAAAALDHPNLVPVYECGEVAGVCYIASAYYAGIDLFQWLQGRTRPLPSRMAAELIACVAEAAHHAHGRGIVHRDLKPSNILLVPKTDAATPISGEDAPPSELDFIPKLTDFGLAKLLETEADQTRSGIVLGTPVYMAPEQAEGWSHAVGPATDVYALGVILYELLTRRLPFQGESVLLTLEQMCSEEPLPPRRINADVPHDLQAICLRCMCKEPSHRYQSAGNLAGDLRRFLRGQSIQARPPGLGERLLNWCRRPQRIRDAAIVALFNAALACFSSGVGLILFLIGVLVSDRPLAATMLFLAGIFGEGLPMAWIGWATSPRRLLPLWAGVLVPFVYPLYVIGVIAQVVDTGGMGEVRERSMLLAQIITVFLLNALTCAIYLVALTAYYSNRRRFCSSPALAPQMLLEPTRIREGDGLLSEKG